MNYFTKELLQKSAIAAATAVIGTAAGHVTKRYLNKHYPVDGSAPKK